MPTTFDEMAEAFRCKVAKQFERDECWKEARLYDEEAPQLTEAGPVPKTPTEFLEAPRRPKRWMCHRTAGAAARVLRKDIAVWQRHREEQRANWRSIEYVCHDAKQEPDPASLVVLCLVYDHFVTAQRQLAEAWPRAFLGTRIAYEKVFLRPRAFARMHETYYESTDEHSEYW